MKNDRTPQEILLAFYLAKFCSGEVLPPEVTDAGYTSMSGLVDGFYNHLGNLSPYVVTFRTDKQFRTSVINLRNGDFKNFAKPIGQFLGKYQPIIASWYSSSSKQLWAEISPYCTTEETEPLTASNVNSSLVDHPTSDTVPPVEDFNPTDEASETQSNYKFDGIDHREFVIRQIRERRGQPEFRSVLLQRCDNRCQITGTKLASVLEAAHIDPYRGPESHHESNGLLLRADVHTLFDLDLLGIEPTSLRIELHPEIREEYQPQLLSQLHSPNLFPPSNDALTRRYSCFKRRCEKPVGIEI